MTGSQARNNPERSQETRIGPLLPGRRLPAGWVQGILVDSGGRSETVPLSSMILHSIYVLIAFTFGEYGAIDGSADAKRELQLTVF